MTLRAKINLVLTHALATAFLYSCSAPSGDGSNKTGGSNRERDKDFASKGFEAPPEPKSDDSRPGSQFSRPSEKDRNAAQQSARDEEGGVNRRSLIETPNPTPQPSPSPVSNPSPTPTPSQNPTPSPNPTPGTAPVPAPTPPPPLGGGPGGHNQCRVLTNRLAPQSLGLAGDTFEQPYMPFTLLVEIEKSGTSSRCVAIVDSQTSEIFVGRFRRKVTFPRLILARHCMRSEPSKPMTKMTFFEPTTGTKTVASVDSEGIIKDSKTNKAMWVFHQDEVNNSRIDDLCTQQAKVSKKPTPCFTMQRDRYTLITPTEAKMIESALSDSEKNGKKIQLDNVQDLLTHDSRLLTLRLPGQFTQTESVIETLPSGADNNIDWEGLFLRVSLRGAKAWDIYRIPSRLFGAGNVETLSKEAMTESFYKFLDSYLTNLRFTSVLRDKYIGPEIVLSKQKSWRDLITIYIDKNANGNFILSAVGLNDSAIAQIKRQSPNFQFRHGDSGTVMLAETRTIVAPLITLRREFVLVGVLSTVAGEPVCEGDDLSCCETK